MHRLDINDQYHAIFIDETREQLEEMEKEVLAFETGGADGETINIILRMAHSIKGSASTMQLTEIKEVVHLLESLFTKVRSGDAALEGLVMDIVLEAIDTLKELHRFLWDKDFEAPDTTSVISKLKLFEGKAAKTAPENIVDKSIHTDSDFTDEEANLLRKAKCSGEKLKITVIMNEDAELKSVKAFMICHGIEELGEIMSISPDNYEELEDEEFGSRIVLLLCTEQGEEAVRSVLESITELKDISIKAFMKPEAEGTPKVKSSKAEPNIFSKGCEFKYDKKIDEKTSVRVNINKIDKLINLMGEFVLDKEALGRLSKELKKKYGKDPSVLRLIDVFAHISYLGSEMEELVLSTRMLPLGNIFDQFPRMIRDLAIKHSKKVNFIIEGKETGIDRGIIEELVDPLNHILRNSIDHGLETEEERIRNGKDPVGTIRLSASQGKNHVAITVKDDGKGIDVVRVREKALEKGIISGKESVNLSDEAMLQYIFEPGFSTARKVSEISGRGVGLDVVKSNISKLHGIIDIDTAPNEGTTFTIKLPLTLAIIKAVLMEEGPCTFAVPVSSIVEIIRMRGVDCKELIHKTGKNEVFSWGDHAIPLVRIGSYFRLNRAVNRDKSYIIVVGNGERKLALMTEQVIGEQEIVIKSIGDFAGSDKLLGEMEGVSGVSILGDGSFAQVIDIAAIMRR